jgi:hypothetical protein
VSGEQLQTVPLSLTDVGYDEATVAQMTEADKKLAVE